MIVEAIDAAYTLGWALLAWIVVGAVTVTAVVYAVAGLLWLAGRWAWKGTARALSAARTDAHGAEAEREHQRAYDVSGARSITLRMPAE